MSNGLNFEAEPFPGHSFEYEGTPTTLRMRPKPIRARILWPALGFPAVIRPQKSDTDPSNTDASRSICVLIVSDAPRLGKEEAAQYLRIVPWSQRGRRQIAAGQPGSFAIDDLQVRNDDGPRKLSQPMSDDFGDAIAFGGAGAEATNPVVVSLSKYVRDFYRKNGLQYLYEIRVSEAASAKLADGQYHLFWDGNAASNDSSDEMKQLIETFAKPQRRKLGARWASWFNFFIEEYTFDYGALHLPYKQGDAQRRRTEVLHPVFVRRNTIPLRIGHVTDTHVDVRWDVYEANLDEARKKGTLTSAVPFNNSNRNFVRLYGEARRDSDAILLTGDLIDYGRGHLGPVSRDTLGQDDFYHEDRNWFLFYYLLASGDNYSVPAYTILGNHDWRLNPYPPFAPGAPEVGELFDAASYNGKKPLTEVLKIAHGPGHEQKYSYSLQFQSLPEVAVRGVAAYFGYLTQDGSPVQTRIESVSWYLLLINPFFNYSVNLPGGQQLLMLDWAKDEELQNSDEPKDWMGFGPRAAKVLTRLQKWLTEEFIGLTGSAKVIGVHAPPLGPYPAWTDEEIRTGTKTYHSRPQSRLRAPDGKVKLVSSHSMFAVRPKDQPYGVAADYGSFGKETERNWFITTVADTRRGVRVVLSGHIHRNGLLRAIRSQQFWMLSDFSTFGIGGGSLRPPAIDAGPGQIFLGPLYVNTTSAGPRGNLWRAQYKNVDPGWTWLQLASDGTIVHLNQTPQVPPLTTRRLPAAPAPTHEYEYMDSGLNFEAEAFGGEQVEYFSPHGMGHAGHGLLGHHRGRRGLFRRGLRSGWFGSGGSLTQDAQSNGWAMQCLAQVTGVQGLRHGRRGHRMRRAIRRFQTQNQLSPTGRLDDDTMAALQEACGGDQGANDGAFDAQDEMGEVQYQVTPDPDRPDALELWFEWNSTKLRQDNEVDSVVHLADAIKIAFGHLKAKKKDGKLVLTGFASTEGQEGRNKELSLQRAQHVKDLLVDAGIPGDRIEVKGAGPSNAWPGGLKWNRRVEIAFLP